MLTLVNQRYEVLEALGSGGEALVVKALDRQHDRFVALKIRRVGDDASREDLLGEARILLAVPPHPALPLVREDFFDGDRYVVAMDWVDGTDLATLLRDRGRPGLAPSSVMAYLAQAAEALTHLHTQSPPVIHGDVKPANLILTKGGKVKLVDFGLSSAPAMPRWRTGTPGFRALELSAGARPSRASDVYALAATAFALLTGDAPAGVLPVWEGIDAAQAEQLEAAIRMGMATDPSHRPATPGELVERLRTGWAAGLPSGVVTFCLSDIEGSTELWDAHPEAMAVALVRHDELIAGAVAAHGGSVVETRGEGGSTVSAFDSAPTAVAAAVDVTRALAAEDWSPGVRIAVRCGINTGEIERRGTEYRGPTMIVAAGLRDQADGGQIFLSSVTSELVAGHLPEGCELVDLGRYRLNGLATLEHVRGLKAPGVKTPLRGADCPYRGLLAFEAEDRGFFFGREEVVSELLGRLTPGRLLAVVGASGSGKSSILRAGVLAAVRAGEVPGLKHVSLLTPGVNPVLDARDEPGQLVIVDQFEELFTQCDDADRRKAFIDGLLGLRCAVAIGVRADLYGRLSAHAALAQAVSANQVLLGAMTAAELERAVTEPARLAGLKLDVGLVELVLRDVVSEPGALPLLSHALRATWERRDGRTLTVEGYRESGGVVSAIARTADAVVDALPDAQRHLTRSVFLRLTEPGEGIHDTRRRVTIDELSPEGAAPETVNALVGRLADARLVTLDDGTVEVAHEALIREWPRLQRWLDEDRAGIQVHRQLSQAARLWEAGGRATSDLYRGGRLTGAADLTTAGRAVLNANERAFLDAGVEEGGRERRAEQRANRRLRGLLGAAVLLLVAAIVGAALSVAQRNHARSAEASAKAGALTSDAERAGALALNAPTLDQALLDALAGTTLQDRVQTQGSLLAVLERNAAAIRTFPVTSANVAAFAVSPDGRLLATGDGVGFVRFFDLRTFKPTGPQISLGRPVSRRGMAFSPDARTLAVGAQQAGNERLYLLDVATRRARRVHDWQVPDLGLGDTKATFAYAPHGRRLAVTVAANALLPTGEARWRLELLDAASGRTVWRRSIPMRPGASEAAALFAPDGSLISSSEQGDTLVWNARTGQVVRRYPIGGRLALSPDGRTLAVTRNSADAGNPTAAVGLIDLRTGHHRTLRGTLPDEQILGLAFTPDAKSIVGPAFNSTHVWDLASGRVVQTYPGTQRTGTNPGVVIDGRGFALIIAGGGAISAWDPVGTRRLARRFPVNGVFSGFDERGERMAITEPDGATAVYDLPTLRRIDKLPVVDGAPSGFELLPATTIAFLPGGRLATSGAAGTVTIRSESSHAVVQRLRFAEPVVALAASPDGRLIAVQRQAAGSRDSHVEVRDLASGRALFTRTVRLGRGSVLFTAGGSEVVASGCCNGGATVVAWDARSGTARFDRSLAEPVTSISTWPGLQRVAVGTQDGRVMLWDARNGRQVGPATKVAAASVFQVALSPDGRSFAAAARNGSTSLWDVRSRQRLGDQIAAAPGIIPIATFEPTGRLLVGDEALHATEWPLDPPTLRRFACNVVGRGLTREEWANLLPNRRYVHVCGAA